MTDNKHIQNILNIESVRGKLEYCVDNNLTAEAASPELLEILEDLQDTVETDLEFNMQAVLSFEHGMTIHEEVIPVLGKERRPLPCHPQWEIDELGNVFNSKGELAYREFRPQWGGYYIRPNKRTAKQPRHLVAQQVLLAFEGASGKGTNVLFRDSDTSNVAYTNLRWIANDI